MVMVLGIGKSPQYGRPNRGSKRRESGRGECFCCCGCVCCMPPPMFPPSFLALRERNASALAVIVFVLQELRKGC